MMSLPVLALYRVYMELGIADPIFKEQKVLSAINNP